MGTKYTWTDADGLVRGGGARAPETTNASTALEDETSRGSKMFTVSAAYTVTSNDVECVLNCTAALTLTIATDAVGGFGNGALFSYYQASAGAITVTGVTLRGTQPTAAQYTTVGLMRVGANEWAYL